MTSSRFCTPGSRGDWAVGWKRSTKSGPCRYSLITNPLSRVRREVRVGVLRMGMAGMKGLHGVDVRVYDVEGVAHHVAQCIRIAADAGVDRDDRSRRTLDRDVVDDHGGRRGRRVRA